MTEFTGKANADGHIIFGCGCRYGFLKGDILSPDCPKHGHHEEFGKPTSLCSLKLMPDGRIYMALSPDAEFVYDPEIDIDYSRLLDRVEEVIANATAA